MKSKISTKTNKANLNNANTSEKENVKAKSGASVSRTSIYLSRPKKFNTAYKENLQDKHNENQL